MIKSLKLNTTGCFTPNLTSDLIVKAALNHIKSSLNILELGCGSGYIGIKIAMESNYTINLSASDIDSKALKTAKINYLENQIKCNLKLSNCLDSWDGKVFDMILCDISAIDESIADITPWYKIANCKSGEGGINLINDVISKSPNFLNEDGVMIFPVISLSNWKNIISFSKNHFKKVEKLSFTEWPLQENQILNKDLWFEKKKAGLIDFEEKFGSIICWTAIFVGVK